MKALRKSGQRDPYSCLAPVYDHMMSHVDYEAWAEYIASLIAKFGNGGRRLVDAGCGTGRFLRALRQRGYRAFGTDISFDMLAECRRRGDDGVWQGDIRNMALRRPADAVVCLYDTLHYLEPGELGVFFQTARNLLNPGGVLIFDVITEGFLRGYWADFSEWDRVKEYDYSRRSWFDPANRCQHTEIRVHNDSQDRTYTEHHRQWLFELDMIPEIAEHNRFSLAGRFGEFTYEPPGEDADRIHFVFRAEAV